MSNVNERENNIIEVDDRISAREFLEFADWRGNLYVGAYLVGEFKGKGFGSYFRDYPDDKRLPSDYKNEENIQKFYNFIAQYLACQNIYWEV